MNTIYGKVVTANIKNGSDYELNVESLHSDIEYNNCNMLIQPGFNTFPKIGDIVLLNIVSQGEYVIIGKIADNIKKGIIIEDDSIELKGNIITANGEDLTTDNT